MEAESNKRHRRNIGIEETTATEKCGKMTIQGERSGTKGMAASWESMDRSEENQATIWIFRELRELEHGPN